jgi:CheY-like chemotaxis protein
MTGGTTQAGNTLRISQPDLDRLTAELDAQAAKSPASSLRMFSRWPFRHARVRVEFRQGDAAVHTLDLASRDLSPGGVSLLHSAYVHAGNACRVMLPHPLMGEVPVDGSIVRCRHVKGVIHELAVRFNQPIRVREFVRIDPFESCFTLERVEPSKLTGSVLHIEDAAMDRQILRHCLRETNLSVTSAETGAEGVRRAGEPFDLILCSLDLADTPAMKVIESIRAADCPTPIVAISADTSRPTRDRLRAARASAFLAKPIAQHTLLRAIGEFVLLGSAVGDVGGAVRCSLPIDDPRQTLVEEFLTELKKYVASLLKAVQDSDSESAKRVCLRIKGAAPSVGFEPLAQAADAALQAINASASVSESRKPIVMLAALCNRAKGSERRKAA